MFTDDDPDGGAFTETIAYSGNFVTPALVNIDTSWLTDFGSTIGSYGYQTYLHEIGHALGLGHAGNYNETATYPYDALYRNDSWATSVMSYFTQTENDYFNGQGFSRLHLVTPMVADILAVQSLYGLSTTTRSGDTTYGFNSNAGGIYNATAAFPFWRRVHDLRHRRDGYDRLSPATATLASSSISILRPFQTSPGASAM